MSFTADHVVVPFATFLERRERRNHIEAAFPKPDRSDAAVKGPSAVGVAISVAGSHTTSAATASECGADESAIVSLAELRPRPKLAPR
jgi:hypothetical protein